MMKQECFRHHDPDMRGTLGIDLGKVWITLEQETENGCVLVHLCYVTSR